MANSFNYKNVGKTPSYREKLKSVESTQKEKSEVFGIKLPLVKGKGKNKFFKMCETLEETIENNLKNFLMTKKGEKIGQSSFGTRLHELYNMTDLENVDNIAADYVAEDLSIYFPNVTVTEYIVNKVEETYTTPASFNITIIYLISGSAKSRSVTITVKTSG